MTTDDRIRLADERDAEVAAELLVAFRDHLGKTWPSDNAFLAGVEKLLAERDTDILLASPDADAPPVAVAVLRYRHGIWRAGTDCLVEDVFVADHARGSGLGRALMDAAIARARERGARRMELDTAEDNAAALALYGSLGFRASEGPDAPRDLYMRMHLDAGPDA